MLEKLARSTSIQSEWEEFQRGLPEPMRTSITVKGIFLAGIASGGKLHMAAEFLDELEGVDKYSQQLVADLVAQSNLLKIQMSVQSERIKEKHNVH